MDERRRRAWAALGLGPRWTLRDALAPVAAGEGAQAAAGARVPAGPAGDGVPSAADLAGSAREATGASREAATALAPSPGDAARDDDLGGRADGPPIGTAVEAAVLAEHDGPADDDLFGGSGFDPRPAAEVAGTPSPQPEREAAIAAMGWDALEEAVSGCTACTLCASRRNTVFGVGPRGVDWMLVGEAPGEQEDLRGEPFVGPAGQLLDRMLEAIGVDRPEEAFIANVLKCRPPRNRDPMPEEVARCEPYLLRQVELARPKVIVALGRFAAQSLLRTDATIASLRGRVHALRVGDRSIPTVVTYHPAYLLRNLPDKSKAWVDLRLARRTFEAQD